MEVLIVQCYIRWLDIPYNLGRLDSMIGQACGEGYRPDLVVLPEMFATGFCMEPGRCTPGGGDILGWMKATAARCDAAVAGTVAYDAAGSNRNRFFFVRPDGVVSHYDKRHLFTYSGENAGYEPGQRRVVVRWRGFDILLQTCYDLRFPVFARNRGDYQLMLYCASWVDRRIAVWDTLLRARAIENASYVIGANRVGGDPAGVYPGHSVAVDYKGNVTAHLPEGKEGCVKCSLSLEKLYTFREKFPVLDDADGFVME